MPEIPSFWRIELLHPALVHFPIALLSVSAFLRFFSVIKARSRGSIFLQSTSRLLLGLGVLFSWITIYSGNLAEGIVNRKLCDPTMTHQHGDWAYYSAYLFTAIFALDFAIFRQWIPRAFEGITRVSVYLGLLIGFVLLVRTAHLGGSLVYLQGAAVYHPSLDCKEFEASVF